MKKNESEIDVTRLLYLALTLWLGYLAALALIDRFFYPHPIFPFQYYLINGLDVLVVLGLLRWSKEGGWAGRVVLPLVIGLMSVIPLLAGHLLLLSQPPGPANDPESLLLRLMPLLLMALILTAWQYRWGHVIIFSLGIAGFSMGLHLFFSRPGGAPLRAPLTLLLIQTVSFLIVGYFINTLMQRLKQQQDSLAQANTQLALSAATLEHLTISRERNRMARELHDTLAHTLSGLSVQLETAKAYWDVDSVTVRRLLEQSLAATRAGLQETRRALKSLRASPLDDLGLLLAVRQLAQSAAGRENLRLALDLSDTLPALAPALEQCIYRVAQEAIANVLHHANAHTLRVSLACAGADVILRVADDGGGFRADQAVSPGHFGLAGMRERAALVGGLLHLRSQSGQGTEIELRVAVN